MTTGLTVRCLSLFSTGLLAVALSAAPGQAQFTFTNNNPITIPVSGVANPYPSTITVSGYTGTITGITVTLTGLTHTWTDDLAALFVGPGGQHTILFNGPGLADGSGTQATNFNLTFGDNIGPGPLPDEADFEPGDYRPGQDQYQLDSLSSPAPMRDLSNAYPTTFASFVGQTPDGTYSLYIEDFIEEIANPATGSLSGWSITIQGITPVPEPATVLAGPALLLAALGLRRRWRAGRRMAAPSVC